MHLNDTYPSSTPQEPSKNHNIYTNPLPASSAMSAEIEEIDPSL